MFGGFGGSLFGHPVRRQRDDNRQDIMPFDPFMGSSHHMMMPFGGDDPFRRMNQMMASTFSGDFRPMGNNGGYQSSVMMMSSEMGPDGQMRVKKYTKSSRGDTNRGVEETRAHFQDSATDREVRALERQIGGRGRKVVHEMNSRTGESTQSDILQGLEDEETHQFDRDWERLTNHLPQYGRHMTPHSVENLRRAPIAELTDSEHRGRASTAPQRSNRMSGRRAEVSHVANTGSGRRLYDYDQRGAQQSSNHSRNFVSNAHRR